MIKLDYAIQDVHGIEYPAAVVVVRNANQRHTSELYVNEVVGETIGGGINKTERTDLSFNAFIYRDIDAKNSGKKPMVLKDADGQEWFNFSSEVKLENETQLVAACEEHLTSFVLPSLKI